MGCGGGRMTGDKRTEGLWDANDVSKKDAGFMLLKSFCSDSQIRNLVVKGEWEQRFGVSVPWSTARG